MSPELGEVLQVNSAEQFKKSIFNLCKIGLRYKDINLETHGEIIRILEDRENKRKLIVVPRGCLKSSLICVAYPIWLLINDPDNTRILIESELYVNAKNFLREIKAHLEGKFLTSVFGQFKSDTWNESEIILKQRTKAFPQANIVIGSMGSRKIGQHFTHIIMDDMNSPENTNTKEMAEKVVSHYKLNTSILEPDGTLVVDGTRYSENDLIGHIIRNEVEEILT